MGNREETIVTVIMSTYNGSSYLASQLESLLVQKDVAIRLFVRDVGSSDDTVQILQQYAHRFLSLDIVEGENLGATESFHVASQLALEKNDPADYYAFCDQDDIWLENKLSIAVNQLSKIASDKPLLYFSNLMMVNNQMEKLGYLLDNEAVSYQRMDALAAISTYGCTCVFNRQTL